MINPKIINLFARSRFDFCNIDSMIKVFQYTFLLGLVIIIFSCRDKELIRSSDWLTFSKDTVYFDTIFTRVGSITKQVKIYNFTKDDIDIRSIYLGKGINSEFRLNIDGFGGNMKENIKIRAQDSLFIFVEVTIDPTLDKLPMVVEDSIVVVTDDKVQDINLLAWGQNMKLFVSWEDIINTSTWINELPYLIYGSVPVDTDEVLTIEAGTKIYFHRYSSLIVQGTLIVNGTKEEPVIFQGDRKDEVYEGYSYNDVPGQWQTIAFIDESKSNSINYAVIKNGATGIQIGDPGKINKPDIVISNTIIDNMSGGGIVAWGATINANNSIISNCGYEALGLFGGNHSFTHCTIANYWDLFPNFSNRSTPAVIVTNYVDSFPYFNYEKAELEVIDFKADIEKAQFNNCIIFGNLDNEIFIRDSSIAQFNNCLFDYNLIRINKKSQELFKDYLGINFYDMDPRKDSLFVDIKKRDYSLDSISYAIDLGSLNYARQVPVDFNGSSRTIDGKPDLGAYEFQK